MRFETVGEQAGAFALLAALLVFGALSAHANSVADKVPELRG